MLYTGMIIGAAIVVLIMWLRSKDIAVKWYEYLMGALAILLAIATVDHYFGSLAGYESTAAWFGALIFGISAIIFAAVAFQLVWRRHRAAG